ncbi:hypothetical protein EON80_12235 [bacterium]|nr:MAG: hypothetical protein EON80_12235 [bacterium]
MSDNITSQMMPNNQRMLNWWIITGCILLLWLTVLAMTHDLVRARLAPREAWRTTSGVVVKTWIQRIKGNHRAHLLYEYEAEGATYQSSEIGPDYLLDFYREAQAQDYLKHYPPGTKIKVHYISYNPGYATLNKPAEATIGPYLFVTFFLAGLTVVLYVVKIYVDRHREKRWLREQALVKPVPKRLPRSKQHLERRQLKRARNRGDSGMPKS